MDDVADHVHLSQSRLVELYVVFADKCVGFGLTCQKILVADVIQVHQACETGMTDVTRTEHRNEKSSEVVQIALMDLCWRSAQYAETWRKGRTQPRH